MNLKTMTVASLALCFPLLNACEPYDPAADQAWDVQLEETSSAATLACPAVDFDFAQRDASPQTDGTKDSKGNLKAKKYPDVIQCGTVLNRGWYRDRVIAVARHFAGTPYASGHHIPDEGIDCSNFVAFVYNYAGIEKFGSTVKTQGQELLANPKFRRVDSWGDLKKGDIIYQSDKDNPNEIGHAAIFIDSSTVIDSTSGKTVGDRTVSASSWYRTRFVFGVRVIPNDFDVHLTHPLPHL